MNAQSNLINFSNETFGQISIITDADGQSWFIAKEIASILEYSDTNAMTRRLDTEDIDTYTDRSSGQGRAISLINESGLYASILGSQKPEAKKFKRWVTSEVLPAIRKTGEYAKPEKEPEVKRKVVTINKNNFFQTVLGNANLNGKELDERMKNINSDEIGQKTSCTIEDMPDGPTKKWYKRTFPEIMPPGDYDINPYTGNPLIEVSRKDERFHIFWALTIKTSEVNDGRILNKCTGSYGSNG